MHTTVINKSQKTLERIESIKNDLGLHYKNIAQLRASFKWYRHLKRHSHMPRKIRFSSLPKSEKVFKFTLQNIKFQIALLERELAALIKFGM